MVILFDGFVKTMDYLGILLCSYFVVLWGVVLFLSKGTRRDIFAVSLIAGLIGPLLEYWHLQDYWHPPYTATMRLGTLTVGLEDFLFSFSFAGICLGFFLFNKDLRPSIMPLNYKGVAIFAVLTFMGLLLTGGMVMFAGVNSLYAVTTAALGMGMFILLQRPPWIKSAIIVAGSAVIVMWSFYKLFALSLAPELFMRFWKPEALSGLAVFSVPVEELIWAASFGIVIGPMYLYSLELSWRGFGERSRKHTARRFSDNR